MKLFLQKLKKRKSRLFWLTTFVLSITLIVALNKVIFGIFPKMAGELTPRFPTLNNNVKVTVDVPSHLLPDKDKFRRGVHVYRFQPELTLVGFVSKVEPQPSGNWHFLLQITKENASDILRDDSRFEFLHTSPSLLAILGRFFNSEKKELLQEQMLGLAKKNRSKITSIFQRLGKSLGKKLGNQKLADQVFKDQALRQEVFSTIESQIIEQIDWDQVYRSIEKNPHSRQVASLVTDNINWKGIITGAVGGGVQGTVDELSSVFVDPEYLPKGGVGRSIKIFSGILQLVLNPQESLEKIKTGVERGSKEGSWNAAQWEIRKVFRDHNGAILKHGSTVLKDAAEESKLSSKILAGFQSLAYNKNLRERIQSHYGEDVWQALAKTFSEASQDREILNNITLISQEIQGVTGNWLENFLLDENKKGPNPLLLVAAREGLTQTSEPQIICHAGSGRRAAENFIYRYEPKKGNE